MFFAFIDLTALFTYRTMSYVVATTLQVQFLRHCCTMSYDIVRHPESNLCLRSVLTNEDG